MAETAEPGATTRPARRSPPAKVVSGANLTALHVLGGRPLPAQPGDNGRLSPKPRRRRRRPKGNAEVMAGLRRLIRAAGERAAIDEDGLLELASLQVELDAAIRRAIQATHAEGYSWGEVGRLFDMTRQGARQRWGR
jgi:hypothetical protein